MDDYCACQLVVYQIRQYAYDILLSLNKLYELVVIADIPTGSMGYIINHMVDAINEPNNKKNRQLFA